ncbi:MAG: DUF2298 domain-containing protein [Chloroflexota bacterium]
MKTSPSRARVYDLLFLLVLLVGAYFRLVGVGWDDRQHPHPDERFLTMVETNMQVKKCTDPALAVEICPQEQTVWLGISDYFNTQTSTINPHNRGFPTFVYGTLPMFLTRYTAELMQDFSLWVDSLAGNINPDTFWGGVVGRITADPYFTGYDQVTIVGRQLSALADLGTIVLLYLIVTRLYGRKVALLAAAFASLAVLQIQQSHYFTVDTFTNFFIFLAIYFAVEISLHPGTPGVRFRSEQENTPPSALLKALLRDRYFLLTLGFGLAYGMAVASKLNAFVVAGLLPAALLIRYLRRDMESSGIRQRSFDDFVSRVWVYLVMGALVSLLVFRVCQPYAFEGPGFFNLKPNPQWIANIREQRAQASGDADVPFALQWARRSHLYSFQNLTVWGLGLPLGILSWAGFLWMGWRLFCKEWPRHALLWGSTAAYFLWQSLQFNPTMRYQLPIYPLLAMMAAWGLFCLARRSVAETRRFNFYPALALVTGITVLTLTAGWAYAFTSIYTRPETRVAASRWIYQNVPGPINVRIDTAGEGTYQQPLAYSWGTQITSETPYNTAFVAHRDGLVSEIVFAHIADIALAGEQTLAIQVALIPDAPADQALSAGSVTADFAPLGDPRGEALTVSFDRPVLLVQEQLYYLQITTSGGALTLAGAAVANETDWDMGLPFRVDGYDAFGGIYRGDLNFQLYWDDNVEKLVRFTETLDQADYIFISSNRQWATITRVPERYPLTTEYYRELIGCPPLADVIWCYNVAQPGDFEGRLGFELVTVFESYPTIGPLVINDQFAEEAFTVYDHSKVLIFQKRADYNPVQVLTSLSSVDLSQVVRLTPRQAGGYSDILLPENVLARQQDGGTWSELFDWDALQNRYPVLGLLLWYLTIFAAGVLIYPFVRAALPGLSDHGYPLARIVALLLWAWLSWMAGSLGIPFSKLTIGICLGLVGLLGFWLAYRQREELKQELKTRWKYFLLVEGLFLGFFLLDLGIRLGNPDLWHPSKGGERPMNFSYLNAVLKSTTFPPYDPWFAGGYINYYYYGYVIVGTPMKFLGIVPSIAYNLVLPTLYAMLAMGAFSVGWNLIGWKVVDGKWRSLVRSNSFVAALAASAGMVLLGNLGIIRMLVQGFQRVAAPGGVITDASLLEKWVWGIKGFWLSVTGHMLVYGPGDWYWFPSRVIPAPGDVEPITEFPLFTFIYGDLHAHMIAFPLAILVIAWAVSVLNARARWPKRLDAVLGIFLGGLAVGALRPTNTWDIYTYLPLTLIAFGYALLRNPDRHLQGWGKRLLYVVLGVGSLVVTASLLYQPFSQWFVQAYSAIDPWKYGRTPVGSYLTHWGLFLFVIISWMVWETRQWMAETPLSALKKLKPHRSLLQVLFALLLAAVAALLVMKIAIGWLVLPLAVWAGILILRPGMADSKRFVLFMIGTALALTLAVELVVVRGDIGRMNTVFKFYLQAWIMFAVSAAAALAWTLPDILSQWREKWRVAWQFAGLTLVACAGLILVLGGMDKIRDRMALGAPHTLDSMAYMAYAQYADFGVTMDLDEDYRAIRWMQENIQGSPVIVEANTVEYHWGSRYTIYTGLPGVVGWNWHQRQQRVYSSTAVFDRVTEISNFYFSVDAFTAQNFLQKYNVSYIIVGQLERAAYAGEGLAKFEQYDGILWREVYRDGQTVIYEVIR